MAEVCVSWDIYFLNVAVVSLILMANYCLLFLNKIDAVCGLLEDHQVMHLLSSMIVGML